MFALFIKKEKNPSHHKYTIYHAFKENDIERAKSLLEQLLTVPKAELSFLLPDVPMSETQAQAYLEMFELPYYQLLLNNVEHSDDTEFVAFLLDNGPKDAVNHETIHWAVTPIFEAARNNDPRMLELLLSKGANPFHKGWENGGYDIIDYISINRRFFQHGSEKIQIVQRYIAKYDQQKNLSLADQIVTLFPQPSQANAIERKANPTNNRNSFVI